MQQAKFLLLSIFCFVFFSTFAQNIQRGYVKTKGRLDSNGQLIPGKRLSGVVIMFSGGQTVVTDANGEFAITLVEGKFYIRNVQKQGYILVDPDILSKQYVFSSNPLVISMEAPEQQMKDRIAIQKNIETALRKGLQERERELDSLRAADKLSEEEYYRRLESLYLNKEKLGPNISEQYTKVDVDLLDERNQQKVACIVNGQIDFLLERQQAYWQTKDRVSEQLVQIEEIVKKEKMELTRHLFSYVHHCQRSQQYDTAAYFLELCATLDTTDFNLTTDIGDEYLSMSLDSKAMDYYTRALKIAQNENSLNYNNLVVAHQKIGNVYLNQNNFRLAVYQFQQALSIIEDQNLDSAYLGKTLIHLGVANNGMKQFGEALEYYRDAMDIYNIIFKTDTCPDIADICNNMGVAYENMGAAYNNKKDTKKALIYYEKAMAIWLSLYGYNNEKIAASYSNIAGIYDIMEEYERAIEFYLKSAVIYKNVKGDKHTDVALIYNNLGTVYYHMSDLPNSLSYFEQALDIMSKFLPDDHPDRKAVSENLEVLKREMNHH